MCSVTRTLTHYCAALTLNTFFCQLNVGNCLTNNWIDFPARATPTIRRSAGNVVRYFSARRKTKPKPRDRTPPVMVCIYMVHLFPTEDSNTVFHSTFPACGAVINLATYKEHAVECKAKIAKVSEVKFVQWTSWWNAVAALWCNALRLIRKHSLKWALICGQFHQDESF